MTATATTPEVAEFLHAVRTHLADLDVEEQREILDGLEADLDELVAERGPGALGDPAAYATELRQAAGLEPRSRTRVRRVALGAWTHLVLDAAAERWRRIAVALPFGAEELLVSLRPVWWVLRGYLAVQSALLWSGAWALTIVPDDSLGGGIATLAAVLLSVQLGRGKLWPGADWRTRPPLRVVLLALNVLAVIMLPVVGNGFSHAANASFEDGYTQGYSNAFDPNAGMGDPQAGIYVGGRWVSNIFPYDASGKPLVGIQLFDQTGRPLSVVTQPEYGDGTEAEVPVDPETGEEMPRVSYPWTNGATQVYNAFPLPSRIQAGEELSPTAFTDETKPAIGGYPFATVPRISLPGILATLMQVPGR